jgi:hypothetical protein
MPQTPKTSKKWENQRYLEKRGKIWASHKRNVPTNLPRDFELKDADGKVYMRLTRGKPVEFVGGPVGEAASAAADIDKAMKGIPSVAWTPPPVEFTPPSKSGPVGVGPMVPIAEFVDPEVFAMYGEFVTSLVEEKHRAQYYMDVSDQRCQRLSALTARAWPGIAISPKWAWGIAMVIWHGKIIIYVVRYKLKAAAAWLKAKFGKKKEGEQKPPEEVKS